MPAGPAARISRAAVLRATRRRRSEKSPPRDERGRARRQPRSVVVAAPAVRDVTAARRPVAPMAALLRLGLGRRSSHGNGRHDAQSQGQQLPARRGLFVHLFIHLQLSWIRSRPFSNKTDSSQACNRSRVETAGNPHQIQNNTNSLLSATSCNMAQCSRRTFPLFDTGESKSAFFEMHIENGDQAAHDRPWLETRSRRRTRR